MDKKELIIGRILELSRKKYPGAEIYLFGSKARGNDRPLSDWDLLILINAQNISFSAETKLMDDIYDIELETGEVISPLIYSKEQWINRYSKTPLFENIKREAIRLV
jgi:predicted nucleotidyltransferase